MQPGLDALEAGVAGIIVATMGSGKSIYQAEMLRRWRLTHPPAEGVIVVTAPTKKLVEQLHATFADVLEPWAVGKFYTGAKQDTREVIVCCNPSVPLLAERLRAAGRPVALWLADECHRTSTLELDPEEGADISGEQMREALGAKRRIGFTATPFGASDSDRLTLFDKVIYRYAPADALRDGVIVPWRIVGLDERNAEMPVNEACVRLMRDLGDRKTRGPGVVNANTIDDANAYCDYLHANGFEARPVHSGISAREQQAAIAALRDGAIDCLVHVAMLVEGVDFPWLRWLCLRRAVKSRVRFIQEVGRALRAHPGKTEAVLLDPNDLFGTFSLSYDEALGWEEDDAEVRLAEEELEACTRPDRQPADLYAARVGALGRYVRMLWLAMVAEGVVQAEKPLGGLGWRSDLPSPQHVNALARMLPLARRLPAEHAASIAAIVQKPAVATKGIVSDAMNLLIGLKSFRGRWTPAAPVRVPPPAAFEVVPGAITDTVFVAGVMRGDLVAVVLVQGSKELFGKVRPKVAGDTWGSLTRRGAEIAIDSFRATSVKVSDKGAVSEVDGVTYIDMKANPAARRAWALIARASASHQASA